MASAIALNTLNEFSSDHLPKVSALISDNRKIKPIKEVCMRENVLYSLIPTIEESQRIMKYLV